MPALKPSNLLKDKTNINPINNRSNEATAEDFSEIGNILIDHANLIDTLSGAATPNSNYGSYTSLSLLQAAYPSASVDGDYAIIDAGIGFTPQIAVWNEADSIWELNSQPTEILNSFDTLANFPLIGVANKLYIALDTNYLYSWDTNQFKITNDIGRFGIEEWYARIFFKRGAVIHNDAIYILSANVELPYNSVNFENELSTGFWLDASILKAKHLNIPYTDPVDLSVNDLVGYLSEYPTPIVISNDMLYVTYYEVDTGEGLDQLTKCSQTFLLPNRTYGAEHNNVLETYIISASKFDQRAVNTKVETTTFNGYFDSTDNNVQKCLDKLDGLSNKQSQIISQQFYFSSSASYTNKWLLGNHSTSNESGALTYNSNTLLEIINAQYGANIPIGLQFVDKGRKLTKIDIAAGLVQGTMSNVRLVVYIKQLKDDTYWGDSANGLVLYDGSINNLNTNTSINRTIIITDSPEVPDNGYFISFMLYKTTDFRMQPALIQLKLE